MTVVHIAIIALVTILVTLSSVLILLAIIFFVDL